jgi:hypothetical protein
MTWPLIPIEILGKAEEEEGVLRPGTHAAAPARQISGAATAYLGCGLLERTGVSFVQKTVSQPSGRGKLVAGWVS